MIIPTSILQSDDLISKRFADLEPEFLDLLNDEKRIQQLWDGLAGSTNSGMVSVGQINAVLTAAFPILSNPDALSRAYHRDEDATKNNFQKLVTREEFRTFLRDVFYFNRGIATFGNVNEKCDLVDFMKKGARLGVEDLSYDLAVYEFNKIAKDDFVSFNAICLWAAEWSLLTIEERASRLLDAEEVGRVGLQKYEREKRTAEKRRKELVDEGEAATHSLEQQEAMKMAYYYEGDSVRIFDPMNPSLHPGTAWKEAVIIEMCNDGTGDVAVSYQNGEEEEVGIDEVLLVERGKIGKAAEAKRTKRQKEKQSKALITDENHSAYSQNSSDITEYYCGDRVKCFDSENPDLHPTKWKEAQVIQICKDGDIAIKYKDNSEEEVHPSDLRLVERGHIGKLHSDVVEMVKAKVAEEVAKEAKEYAERQEKNRQAAEHAWKSSKGVVAAERLEMLFNKHQRAIEKVEKAEREAKEAKEHARAEREAAVAAAMKKHMEDLEEETRKKWMDVRGVVSAERLIIVEEEHKKAVAAAEKARREEEDARRRAMIEREVARAKAIAQHKEAVKENAHHTWVSSKGVVAAERLEVLFNNHQVAIAEAEKARREEEDARRRAMIEREVARAKAIAQHKEAVKENAHHTWVSSKGVVAAERLEVLFNNHQVAIAEAEKARREEEEVRQKAKVERETAKAIAREKHRNFIEKTAHHIWLSSKGVVAAERLEVLFNTHQLAIAEAEKAKKEAKEAKRKSKTHGFGFWHFVETKEKEKKQRKKEKKAVTAAKTKEKEKEEKVVTATKIKEEEKEEKKEEEKIETLTTANDFWSTVENRERTKRLEENRRAVVVENHPDIDETHPAHSQHEEQKQAMEMKYYVGDFVRVFDPNNPTVHTGDWRMGAVIEICKDGDIAVRYDDDKTGNDEEECALDELRLIKRGAEGEAADAQLTRAKRPEENRRAVVVENHPDIDETHPAHSQHEEQKQAMEMKYYVGDFVRVFDPNNPTVHTGDWRMGAVIEICKDGDIAVRYDDDKTGNDEEECALDELRLIKRGAEGEAADAQLTRAKRPEENRRAVVVENHPDIDETHPAHSQHEEQDLVEKAEHDWGAEHVENLAALLNPHMLKWNAADWLMAKKINQMVEEAAGCNWIEIWSPDHRCYYYFNEITEESVWETPIDYRMKSDSTTLRATLRLQKWLRSLLNKNK
eukprot:g4572.t1